MELLSRAYQAVVRTIDEAIHGMVQEGHTPSLPARIEDRDIDELAGDLAREGPAQPERARSAFPVAAGPATDPAELLPDTSKSTRFRLVNLLAMSVASIGCSLSRASSCDTCNDIFVWVSGSSRPRSQRDVPDLIP